MLGTGGDQIDAGGLDGAVAQHVGQPGHVPAHPVKGAGEQVAQVVGEHLAGLHPRPAAQELHLRPDLLSGQTAPASGEKDLAGGDLFLSGVLQKPAAQLPREQDGAHLPLQADLRPPPAGGLHRQIPPWRTWPPSKGPAAPAPEPMRSRSAAGTRPGPAPGARPGKTGAGGAETGCGSPPTHARRKTG